MSEKAYNSWEEYLNPDKLKLALTQAAIYLASYEIFKSNIIEKLRFFFTDEWELNEETGEVVNLPNANYTKEVLHLSTKGEFYACCLWFQNRNALNEDDLKNIALIRKHRNLIAHELPKFLGGQGNFVNLDNLNALANIQGKLDNWWLHEVELPTTPDVNEEYLTNVNLNGVLSGSSVLLKLLTSIFDGNDAELKELHNHFLTVWHLEGQ